MKLGIMQPYFFPYIGYWQLINVVDEFIVYDDVNYIKGGWINRNQILVQGQTSFISLRIQHASPNKLIKDHELATNSDFQNQKILKTLQMSYSKAPNYILIYELIKSILSSSEQNLAKFLFNSIRTISEYLEIDTNIIFSSEIKKNNQLKGQDKILELCKIRKANTYFNAIGGQELYSKIKFEEYGINLQFIKTGDISYKQFQHDFIPHLSIIDVMMFNDVKTIKNILNNYVLI